MIFFRKKLNLLLLFSFALLACSSESEYIEPQNDNNALATMKDIAFNNLSNAFNIKGRQINTYFINNEDVPYVEALEFIQSLDGYIKCGSTLRYKYYENKNMLVFSYYYNSNPSSYIQFQGDRNKIYVSDLDFFSNIVNYNQSTNYSSYIKYTDFESSNEQSVMFDIGTYYFDILYYKGKCLIPFVIANMLFCSLNYYNLFYTDNCYYGYYGEIYNQAEEYNTIFNNSLNGQTQSNAMRKASINSFLFAMDKFYGLKYYKGITLFKDYISDDDFSLLWSSNADDNFLALQHILLKNLDEIHTRINGHSMFSNKQTESPYYLNDCGKLWNKFYFLKSQQSALRKQILGETILPVRYYDDTAIITFDSFVTGSNTDIYDNDGNVKDTAWEYDTYFFMQHCMNEITQHAEIKDIVINLSLNGGGNVGAMMRTLGFLSDDVLLDYSYDSLTKEYSCSHYKIDTDGDGYYDDDAFDQYRWTILSSLNTFSAANDFICKVKQQNLAKVIGNTSGGGMCSVLPLVLANGTPITISSNNLSVYYKNKTYYAIENGLNPDLEIPYSDYYDISKISSYVDTVWSNGKN